MQAVLDHFQNNTENKLAVTVDLILEVTRTASAEVYSIKEIIKQHKTTSQTTGTIWLFILIITVNVDAPKLLEKALR